METLKETYEKNIMKKTHKEQLLEAGFVKTCLGKLMLNIDKCDFACREGTFYLQIFVDLEEKEEILFKTAYDENNFQGKNSFTIKIPQKYFFDKNLSLLDFIQINIDNIRLNLNFDWIYKIL